MQGLLAGEAPAAALSCANAMGAFVATQVRANPNPNPSRLGVSKMNEVPLHYVKRLQRAKKEAEGFRAQCSEHPAQEVAFR